LHEVIIAGGEKLFKRRVTEMLAKSGYWWNWKTLMRSGDWGKAESAVAQGAEVFPSTGEGGDTHQGTTPSEVEEAGAGRERGEGEQGSTAVAILPSIKSGKLQSESSAMARTERLRVRPPMRSQLTKSMRWRPRSISEKRPVGRPAERKMKKMRQARPKSARCLGGTLIALS